MISLGITVNNLDIENMDKDNLKDAADLCYKMVEMSWRHLFMKTRLKAQVTR